MPSAWQLLRGLAADRWRYGGSMGNETEVFDKGEVPETNGKKTGAELRRRRYLLEAKTVENEMNQVVAEHHHAAVKAISKRHYATVYAAVEGQIRRFPERVQSNPPQSRD